MTLSTTMFRTLREIEKTGGSIHCLGGGYWGSQDRKFKFVIRNASERLVPIETTTIYALESRGMLRRLHYDDRRFKDSRIMTTAGRQVIIEHRSDIMAGYCD